MAVIIPAGSPMSVVKAAVESFTADDVRIIDLPGPPKSDRELFIIPQSLLDTLTIEDVNATVQALKELDLYRLPYPAVDIQLPARAILRVAKHNAEPLPSTAILTIYNISTDPAVPFRSIFTWTTNKTWAGDIQSACKDISLVRGWLCDTLIVLLATRNIVKSKTENKLAKLGIGKKNTHRYVTTLSLPREPDNDEHTPTGRELAPHLRRGHIRRQHYGPKNSFIKSIWIEPLIVNADKEFVSKRQAYNVSF